MSDPMQMFSPHDDAGVLAAAPVPPRALAGKRVRVDTMGCRVNRYDAAQLRAELSAMGCTVVADDAFDLYLLNTCTVTHSADADARRLARRAKRQNPHAQVVLTGCYAQVAPEVLRAMPEVDLVVGNSDKYQLPEQLASLLMGNDPAILQPTGGRRWGESLFGAGDRPLPDQGGDTRFFLKVQEGCDVACAYCIIPTARGRARSMPPADVIANLQRAQQAGYVEAVLAGIHLGGYGEEIGSDFTSLVQRVLDETELPRIRFGSVEPWGLSDAFVTLFASNPRLLPFLHLPLQSGSAAVLKNMRRPCTPAYYLSRVQPLLDARPDLFLSTDVLTGFPGETAQQFEEGFAFIESLPFAHLHVFPYSRRAGTPAAEWADQVDERVKRERVGRLIALSEAKQHVARERMLGTTTEVLVERPGRGHSHNNHPVRITAATAPQAGQRVWVEITDIDTDGLVGRLL